MSKINKHHVKYAIDIGMLITFILSFITGIFKFPGITGLFNPVFRIIPGFYMNKIHDWSGLIMGLLVLSHLVFNWNWIVCMTKNMFKTSKRCDDGKEKSKKSKGS